VVSHRSARLRCSRSSSANRPSRLATDDFLLVGENGSGTRRKLAGQVKRTFTVSATDDDCKHRCRTSGGTLGTLSSSHRHRSPRPGYAPGDEHSAGTLFGTPRLRSRYPRWGRIRTSIATPGFISAKVVTTARTPNNRQCVEGEISRQVIWPLLRVVHVLSLDLNTARTDEAMIKSLLAHTTGEPDPIAPRRPPGTSCSARSPRDAEARSSLTAICPRRCGSGTPRSETLSSVRSCGERSFHAIVGGIRSTIGGDVHLGRSALVQEVIDELESTHVVLISDLQAVGSQRLQRDAIGVLATVISRSASALRNLLVRIG